MGTPDIFEHLAAAGVRLTRDGGNLIAAPRSAVTPDVLHLIRQHKPELLAALADQPPNVPPAAPTIAPDEPGNLGTGVGTPDAEARRQRVFALLAARPDIRYAVLTDTQADPEAVLLALAIRGQATAEFRIPAEKYDPFLLLELIERHGGTIH